jgi:hypothetical protein
MNSWRPWTRGATSTRSSGRSTAGIAASAGSWHGEEDQIGHLLHKPGGAEHARWVFDYDASGTDDDESGYRFGLHAFAPGEYVSLHGDDGELHTFRVASVEAA